MQKRVLAALMFCIVIDAAAAAAPSSSNTEVKNVEFQLFVDNDRWAKSDRYYTNGLKAGLGFGVDSIPGRKTALKAFDLLGGGIGCESPTHNGGVFVGQNIYTPRDIQEPSPQPFDRPWAAWLYGGVALQASRTCGKRETLDTIEFDLGVVGPVALGEEVQNFWHRFIHVPEARGWDNQIPNEVAFLLTYLHKEKYAPVKYFEIIPHAGAAVGTVMTFVRTGALVRVGHNMSGFGPDRIEPGAAILQNFGKRPQCESWRLCEAYVFAGADARIVFWNIFLDGTVFRGSPSVDRKPLVYDLSFGFAVRFGMLRFTVGRVTRSEEFTTALRGAGKQTFHSFNLSYEH